MADGWVVSMIVKVVETAVMVQLGDLPRASLVLYHSAGKSRSCSMTKANHIYLLIALGQNRTLQLSEITGKTPIPAAFGPITEAFSYPPRQLEQTPNHLTSGTNERPPVQRHIAIVCGKGHFPLLLGRLHAVGYLGESIRFSSLCIHNYVLIIQRFAKFET
jgi:hypothetical protein